MKRRFHTTRSLFHWNPENAEKFVSIYSKKPATDISLETLYDFGRRGHSLEQRLKVARFVWKEIPIRVSHRIADLTSLPYGLSQAQSVVQVRTYYLDSFIRFLACPEPRDAETEKQFVNILSNHIKTLGSAPVLMSQALLEAEHSFGPVNNCPFLNSFLDRFFLSRVATRLMTGQYIAVYNDDIREDWVGQIHAKCQPAAVLQETVLNARAACQMAYGHAPQVLIRDPKHVCFKYIPDHLSLICLELLKNALCATVKYHKKSKASIKNGDSSALPPIKCIIVDGAHDVTIKISDEGGGMSRETVEKVWNYFYSNNVNEPRTIAGFGYGLPISRVYAQFFQGDLELYSMEGHGTDAYLYLPKLDSAAKKLQYSQRGNEEELST